MSFVKRLLHSPYSSIILSVLLGIGLSTLFRDDCKNDACLVDTINDPTHVYKYKDTCYKLGTRSSKCHPTKRSIMRFNE